MEFIVTTALKKLLRLKKRIKVVRGGTSASKTFSILPILIDRAIKTPDLEISVVSESIPHLRRGALKDFLKIMMALGRYNDNQFNKSTLNILLLTEVILNSLVLTNLINYEVQDVMFYMLTNVIM
jgi:hypothetical protein